MMEQIKEPLYVILGYDEVLYKGTLESEIEGLSGLNGNDSENVIDYI